MKKTKKTKVPEVVISDRCRTVYPILLVHGVGFRDNLFFKYWGRIPIYLERNGAKVFYSNTNAWGTIEKNSATLVKRIDMILAETGVEKINIIAHSKGGLEARYLISSLGYGGKVASLSTIATPHHGAKAMDIYLAFPKWFRKFIAFFPNLLYRLFGDKKPDFYKGTEELGTKFCLRFNAENPDPENVYCQSFTTVMTHFYSDLFMCFPYWLTYIVEGHSDGLVTPKSAEWANFRGIINCASSRRGISHIDSIDLRRRRLTKKKADGKYSDITDFYIELVEGLKVKGF